MQRHEEEEEKEKGWVVCVIDVIYTNKMEKKVDSTEQKDDNGKEEEKWKRVLSLRRRD